MTLTLTRLVVPTFAQMLNTLSGWLDKAQATPGGGGDGLLSARLAPDMFPLSTQVRFACVQAWEAAHRLAGQEFPPTVAALLQEGRDAGDRPGTIAEAQARIRETIAMLDRLAPDALDGDPERPVEHALPVGVVFDLTAERYARDWTLPQFYFHLMIAYAILRSHGVELGKADYIPHLAACIRPGTWPVS